LPPELLTVAVPPKRFSRICLGTLDDISPDDEAGIGGGRRLKTRSCINTLTWSEAIMNIRNTLLWSLVSFFSLFLFILNASAQCTPVVYAFRHAEDAEDGSYLTQVGRQHADNLPDIETALLPSLLGNICDTTDLATDCQIRP
jgi:hypothetical protein